MKSQLEKESKEEEEEEQVEAGPSHSAMDATVNDINSLVKKPVVSEEDTLDKKRKMQVDQEEESDELKKTKIETEESV